MHSNQLKKENLSYKKYPLMTWGLVSTIRNFIVYNIITGNSEKCITSKGKRGSIDWRDQQK